MSSMDDNAYSGLPVHVGIGVIALFTISGILCGGKTLRLPWTAWLSLIIGGYFFIRCVNSYSIVESWKEAGLITGCAVFYLAGIYGAQSKNYHLLKTTLILALLVNIFFYFITPGIDIDMIWSGRPEYGLSGKNTPPTTAFVYKNFAGSFLCIAGFTLTYAGMWIRTSPTQKYTAFIVGLTGIILSFFCSTRAVYLLTPILLVSGWIMWIILRLFNGNKLGWFSILTTASILIAATIAIFELIWGHHFLQNISDIDTHLRYMIWGEVSQAIRNAPAIGYGTMASHWEIVQTFHEWSTPNMAHNEYLQAWCDYGWIGALSIIGLLLLHIIWGGRALMAEHISPQRRACIAISLIVLIAWMIIAATDFVFHSYAIATMAAYCCGILTSPYTGSRDWKFHTRNWKKGHEPAPTPVSAQGTFGRGLLALLACLTLSCTTWLFLHLHKAWCAQWTYNKLHQPYADPETHARRTILETLIDTYPDPVLADQFYSLPLHNVSPERCESILRKALIGNPKQMYTITMLVDILGRHKKFEEAEKIMRRTFINDGPKATSLANWPSYYSYNLLRRGCNELTKGNSALGLSMIQYALNIHSHTHIHFNRLYRAGKNHWRTAQDIHPEIPQFIKYASQQAAFLRRIKVKPDDSWMAPLEPNGKPALYQRWGLRPKTRGKK